jgi:hypothetical protein
MKTVIIIASLLAEACCHGAESFGLPLFDVKPAVVESYAADWHAPLLPPELLPLRVTNPTPAIAASPHPLAGPPGSILGVSRAADKRSLTIQYELAGKTNEQRVILTNGIAEFHFCSWVIDRGIALALSDSAGEVYWATAYFARLAKPIYPRKIRSPHGYRLMGIASPGGDTIVITAMDVRGDEDVLARGWMYKNSCPPAWDVFIRAPTNAPAAQIQMSGFDYLTEFEIPRRKAETKK